MKANIFLRDTKLVETSGGATIRYSNVNKKTFNVVRELLDGFDEIEIFTDTFCVETDLGFIDYLILNNYKVKLTFNNNINSIKEF